MPPAPEAPVPEAEMKPPADRIEDLPRLIEQRRLIWDQIHKLGSRTAALTQRIQHLLDHQAEPQGEDRES